MVWNMKVLLLFKKKHLVHSKPFLSLSKLCHIAENVHIGHLCWQCVARSIRVYANTDDNKKITACAKLFGTGGLLTHMATFSKKPRDNTNLYN